MGKQQLKILNILVGLQSAEWLKIWKKCNRTSTRTIGIPSKTAAASLVIHTVHANKFSWRNSTGGKSLLNLFHTWYSAGCVQKTPGAGQNNWNFLSKVITGDKSWVYGLDPKQRSSHPNEIDNPTATKESKACQEHYLEYANLLLSHEKNLSTRNVFSRSALFQSSKCIRENLRQKFWTSGAHRTGSHWFVCVAFFDQKKTWQCSITH